MSYKILSLKWRPSEFSEIIGQDHISQALSNAIKLNRVAQAFIFSGPRGVGKTTAARVLAKKLNDVNSLNDSIDIISYSICNTIICNGGRIYTFFVCCKMDIQTF